MVSLRSSPKKPGNCVSNWNSFPLIPSRLDSKAKLPVELHARIEDEIGDLFFVMVNLARRLSVDPESALRRTNRKFRSRFGWLEQKLQERGTSLEDAPLELMEELWQRAKLSEEGRH